MSRKSLSMILGLLLSLTAAAAARADCIMGDLGPSSSICHSVIIVTDGDNVCASFTSTASAKFTVFSGVNAANLVRVLKFNGTSDYQLFHVTPGNEAWQDCLTNTDPVNSISFTLCLTDNPVTCP